MPGSSDRLTRPRTVQTLGDPWRSNKETALRGCPRGTSRLSSIYSTVSEIPNLHCAGCTPFGFLMHLRIRFRRRSKEKKFVHGLGKYPRGQGRWPCSGGCLRTHVHLWVLLVRPTLVSGAPSNIGRTDRAGHPDPEAIKKTRRMSPCSDLEAAASGIGDLQSAISNRVIGDPRARAIAKPEVVKPQFHGPPNE